MIEIKKKHLDCECNTFHRIHPFYFTRIVVQIDDRISNVSEHDYEMHHLVSNVMSIRIFLKLLMFTRVADMKYCARL